MGAVGLMCAVKGLIVTGASSSDRDYGSRATIRKIRLLSCIQFGFTRERSGRESKICRIVWTQVGREIGPGRVYILSCVERRGSGVGRWGIVYHKGVSILSSCQTLSPNSVNCTVYPFLILIHLLIRELVVTTLHHWFIVVQSLEIPIEDIQLRHEMM